MFSSQRSTNLGTVVAHCWKGDSWACDRGVGILCWGDELSSRLMRCAFVGNCVTTVAGALEKTLGAGTPCGAAMGPAFSPLECTHDWVMEARRTREAGRWEEARTVEQPRVEGLQ